MIPPGVPPLGTQQEVFKPQRQVKTTAAAGVPHEPLSELPVDDSQQQQEQRQSEQPPDEDKAGETVPSLDDKAAAEDQEPGSADLPRKGLLVDIRA